MECIHSIDIYLDDRDGSREDRHRPMLLLCQGATEAHALHHTTQLEAKRARVAGKHERCRRVHRLYQVHLATKVQYATPQSLVERVWMMHVRG